MPLVFSSNTHLPKSSHVIQKIQGTRGIFHSAPLKSITYLVYIYILNRYINIYNIYIYIYIFFIYIFIYIISHKKTNVCLPPHTFKSVDVK